MQLPLNRLYPTDSRALTVTTPTTRALSQTSDRAYRVLFTRGEDLIAPPTYRSTFERQLERLLANTQGVSDEYLTRAYSASMVSNSCIEYRASTSAMVAEAFYVETVDGQRVDDGTLEYFLSIAPNLIAEIVRWLLISGRFYARKRYNAAGYPTGLDVLNPLDVHEVESGGLLSHYEVYNGINRERVEIQEIISARLFDPRPDGNGMSKLEAAWLAANIEQGIATHAASFFINGAAPDGFLTFDEPLTEPEYEDARQEWRANFKGAKNAHKTAVMPGKARWQTVGAVPKDLAMVELDDKVTRKICAIFQTDPILVNQQGVADPLGANSTYNKTEVAHLRNVAIPFIMMLILDALNKQWVQKDINPSYIVTIDQNAIPALADANLVRADTAISLSTSHVIDYAEARKMTGQSETRSAYFIRKPDDALAAFLGGGLTLNMFHNFTLGSSPLGMNGDVLIIGGQLFPAANLLEIAVANVDKAKAPPPSPFGGFGGLSAGNPPPEPPPAPQNTPNLAPDSVPPTPEPPAVQSAVDAPLRAMPTTLEIAALFPENTFVRYARRTLSDYLSSQGVTAEWVDERDWRLPLARVHDAAPSDVLKLILRGAYGEGRKIDCSASGYEQRDGVIYWRVNENEALATLRKTAQTDAGGDASATGIALCKVDSVIDVTALADTAYPLVVANVGLLRNGEHEHSWALRGASGAQQRELTNWQHVTRRKGKGHAFTFDALKDHPIVDWLRDATDSDCDLDDVFEVASAVLRGELTIRAYPETRQQFTEALADLIRKGFDSDIDRRNFAAQMRVQLRRLGLQAFRDGFNAGGQNPESYSPEELAAFRTWLNEQSQFVTAFGKELFKQGISEPEIALRADMWTNKSLDAVYYLGLKFAVPNKLFRWKRNPEKESCTDCIERDGVVRTLEQWEKVGLPGDQRLSCHGYLCGCELEPVRSFPKSGRFS